MSTTHQQFLHFNGKGPVDSIQSRLALLSHLTEKQEGSSIYKKKTFFWDQEHLYSENLMLKSQVKQLTQANTKSRTTILEMEAEMKQRQSRNNEHELKQSTLRSMSLRNFGKKSMIAFRPLLQEEGKSKSIRQIIRELKEEITALKNENEIMKRSLKYTRMSELQTLNKEMDIELQRLNRLVNENKNKYFGLALEMEALNELLKKEKLAKQLFGQERDKLKKELVRIKKDNSEFQKRIQMSEKQSRQETKKLRSINPEIAVFNTESAIKSLNKFDPQSFKSIPKLQYSISGLQRIENDTINFDRLLNSDSQLKSIPKITSFTSLELQKMSFKNEGNSPEAKVKTSEKVESCSEIGNLEEEAYEFEEDEVEEIKKTEEPKPEEIYEQDETQIIKPVYKPKLVENFEENDKKVVKQKNETKTEELFEEEDIKISEQAEKLKPKPKQEEWEEELEEYDDNDKQIVKQVNVQKPEELVKEDDAQSDKPISQPKKEEPAKVDTIVTKTKQQPDELFEEDDAEIIKQIEEPLPEEEEVEEPKTESKQHLPLASIEEPLPEEEEVKEPKTESKQPLPLPSKIQPTKSPKAKEARKEEIVEEEVQEQVKEESVFEDLMVEEV